MRLIALVCILFLLAVFFVGCTDVAEDDNTTVVKAGQAWGSEAPPYVIDGAATSTTTTSTSTPRPKPRARTAPNVHTASVGAPAIVDGAWSCGGDLPPCWVLKRENPNRDLQAYNGGCHAPVGYEGPAPCGPGHSTASGKWQIVRGTWARFMGYVNAADAPWEVQDARARQLWALCPRERHWGTC